MDEFLIDDLQSIRATALSELFAVLQAQLFRHNDQLLDLGLESRRRPDDAADRLLQTFVQFPETLFTGCCLMV